MRYGDLVTVTGDRILVHPKELAPVGIYHQAEACGVWLPNMFPTRGDSPRGTAPQHLLLSPIYPKSWPAVARFVLRLQRNDEALCRALSVLAKLNFNILSYDCTPSGYHHLTWTIVAEACDVLNDKVLLGRADALRERMPVRRGRGAASAQKRFKFANQEFAPVVLRCLRKALSVLTKEDAAQPFLHQAFVKCDTAFGGQLYNHKDLASDIRPFGRNDRIRAASVSWIQSLAFFWLYGSNVDQPLTFRYDNLDRCLVCSTGGGDGLSAMSKKWFRRLPVTSIALFDPADRYCRIFFSDCDEDGLYSTELHADARFSQPDANTKGLLREVFIAFREANYLSLHATHTVRNRTATSETTGVVAVGVRSKIVEGSAEDGFLERLRNGLAALDGRLLGPETKLQVSRPLVRPLRADNLFLSTKAEWINTERSDLKDALIGEAAVRGFNLQIMDNEIRGGTAQQAIRMIRSSQAFLQVLPKSKRAKGGGNDWMMYERGAAECAGLPWAVCVDEASPLASVLSGRGPAVGTRFSFDGRGQLEEIVATIARAMDKLRRECDARTAATT